MDAGFWRWRIIARTNSLGISCHPNAGNKLDTSNPFQRVRSLNPIPRKHSTKLTNLHPKSFTIELGAALTVMVASRVGIPVSTTLCMVGSVVSVGWIANEGSVDWKLLGKIFLAWVLTFPLSGCISALVFASLRPAL